jgi:predicted  nucleic acid-binding Zn-ribbon protein
MMQVQWAKDVRRAEAELKLCHQAISEQEKELQEQVSKMARKERDYAALASAVQDHSETAAKTEKELKATLV